MSEHRRDISKFVAVRNSVAMLPVDTWTGLKEAPSRSRAYEASAKSIGGQALLLTLQRSAIAGITIAGLNLMGHGSETVTVDVVPTSPEQSVDWRSIIPDVPPFDLPGSTHQG